MTKFDEDSSLYQPNKAYCGVNGIPFHSTQIAFKNDFRVKFIQFTHKIHITEKSIHE